TVTLLATDLVGSTLINQRLGDEAATTLEREIADLAQVQVEKQRGVVITSAGDGLMVAFQSARRAVACAQEIQRGIARLNRGLPGAARTRFVARGPERARVLRAVERAREGAGALLLLVGEAGVGKTRLVEEAAAEARRLGLRVLTGHCVDQQGAPPYLPTIE